MSALYEYYALMARLFESRHHHVSSEIEDIILDDMDRAWHRMNAEEQQIANQLAHCIASGEISEEYFIGTYTMQAANAISNEQPAILETKGEVIASPFIQTSSFSVPWSRTTEKTQYVGFTSSLKPLDIQTSRALA